MSRKLATVTIVLCSLGIPRLSAMTPRQVPTRGPVRVMTMGDTVVIDSTNACQECTIVAEHILTLGGAQDSVAVYGIPPLVRSKHHASYYLITMPPTQIAVYDSAGVLKHLIGRSGRGPGEFTTLTRIVIGPSDSVLALDDFGRRASIFDPSDSFIRSFVLKVAQTAASSAHWLADGSFLVGGLTLAEGRAGFPLHRLNPEGDVVRSFGAYPAVYDPAYDVRGMRRSTIRHDTLWATRIDRYAIDVLSLDGDHLRTLIRRAPWFPDRERTPSGPWGTYLPPPYMEDLSFDADGNLWVVMVLGRPEWVPDKQVDYVSGARREYWRTLIEVLDPKSGRLIARTFMDQFCDGFTEPGVIYTHREDEQGDVVYDIWDIALVRGTDADGST